MRYLMTSKNYSKLFNFDVAIATKRVYGLCDATSGKENPQTIIPYQLRYLGDVGGNQNTNKGRSLSEVISLTTDNRKEYSMQQIMKYVSKEMKIRLIEMPQ